MILTVDLAAKMSAAIVRDYSGEVHWESDSLEFSPGEFVSLLHSHVVDFDVRHILVEDVPYGISNQAMVKPVTRLQGMLMHAMGPRMDFMYFINPSSWQNEYPGVGRAPKGLSKAESLAYRAEKARQYAEALGYTPPNLVQQYIDTLPKGARVLKKNTKDFEKVMTDYVDAYLMSDWLLRHLDDYTTRSGVQIANI